MDKTYYKVLKECIENARKGETDINVFDLMYETSLPYPELKDILDELVSESELVQADLKTYKFIGELDHTAEQNEKRAPLFENVENSPHKDAAYTARRNYMEQRRKEMLEMMKQEQLLQEYVGDGEATREIFVADDPEPIGDLSEYVIKVFQEKLNPDVFIEPPLHPSWNDKTEFMQSCVDHLIILMNSDRQMGRLKAIKKARALLAELQKERKKKTAEIYEYMLYALSYMSNYYYNKIRENLV